jgi:hypothetical protein
MVPKRLFALCLVASAYGLGGCGAPLAEVPDELGDPMRPERGVVRIHLESTDPSRELELVGFGATRLEPSGNGTFRPHRPSKVLCKSPCDAVIDGRGAQPLLVTGPGAPTSAPFLVEEFEGDLLVSADPGSSALSTTGTVAAAVGGLGALVGGGVLVLGLVTRTGELTDTPDSLMAGGGIALGASALVFGAGLLMRYVGATYVDLTPQGVAW